MSFKKAAFQIYKSIAPYYRFTLNLIDSPAIVLLYHRVDYLENDPQLLAVKPENFDKQVSFLKKNYSLLEIDEFAQLVLRKKKLPGKSVIITFDDGYADNLHRAIPVLEKNQAQALFFIATGNVDTDNEFWWDTLERVFFNKQSLPPSVEITIGNQKYFFETASAQQIEKTYHLLHPLVKFQKAEQRKSIMQQLCNWSDISIKGSPQNRIMASAEIKKMTQSRSAVIGAHTVTHTPMSVLGFQEQLQEVKQSKEFLENLIGKKVKYFSYPYGGKKDYNQNSIAVCRQVSFDMVFSNFPFQVHSWTDTFQIPRMIVRDWDFEYFKNQLKKFFKY